MQRLRGDIRGAVPFDRAQVPELQVIQHPPDLKKGILMRFLHSSRSVTAPLA
jgi:hypothetical protein